VKPIIIGVGFGVGFVVGFGGSHLCVPSGHRVGVRVTCETTRYPRLGVEIYRIPPTQKLM
jgi:hypothetical protein